jgi:hypothetical protein
VPVGAVYDMTVLDQDIGFHARRVLRHALQQKTNDQHRNRGGRQKRSPA